jgi:hypothetical protein
MNLEEIAAHLEIQQVLYRYCRGVDRGDADLVASVYHPDAVDAHGPWSGRGKDFGPYIVKSMDRVPVVGQHHITNVLIELDGNTANVESYFVAMHPEARAEGAGHALVCGRYLDRFEQRDGAWLIADRKVVLDVARALPQQPAWSAAAYFPSGGRREADPVAPQTVVTR